MGEKQTVIKELPPAKWHGDLWNDISAMKLKNTTAMNKEKKLDIELANHKQVRIQSKMY